MSKCSTCNKDLDTHVGLDSNRSPKVGDWSVCGHCGTIARFDNSGDLQEATKEELVELGRRKPKMLENLLDISLKLTDGFVEQYEKDNNSANPLNNDGML